MSVAVSTNLWSTLPAARHGIAILGQSQGPIRTKLTDAASSVASGILVSTQPTLEPSQPYGSTPPYGSYAHRRGCVTNDREA